jgi:D-alanine-D-alanine ligase
VKPNQEGSSKGVSAHVSVCDNEEALRAVVRDLLDRYRQPALVEDYIPGREFTVGLLGDKRPRALPPMEIVFRDKGNQRPVYDYQIKQEWEKHVYYECPAKLTPAELKGIERVCKETFDALDCRDVARVDLRVNAKGDIYVLEVNPLPGLTPDYSDLCLIAKAANIEYRALIGEILAGGLKRLREKRRAEAAKSGVSAVSGTSGAGAGAGIPSAPMSGSGSSPSVGNGNGKDAGGNGNGNGSEDKPGVSGA